MEFLIILLIWLIGFIFSMLLLKINKKINNDLIPLNGALIFSFLSWGTVVTACVVLLFTTIYKSKMWNKINSWWEN